MTKVYEWKCSECGKEISSIYKLQFEHNKSMHIESHKSMIRKKSKPIKELKDRFENDTRG